MYINAPPLLYSLIEFQHHKAGDSERRKICMYHQVRCVVHLFTRSATVILTGRALRVMFEGPSGGRAGASPQISKVKVPLREPESCSTQLN
jgi:hypothetical protein